MALQRFRVQKEVADLTLRADQYRYPCAVPLDQRRIAVHIHYRHLQIESDAVRFQLVEYSLAEAAPHPDVNGQFPSDDPPTPLSDYSGTRRARNIGLPCRCTSTGTDLPAGSFLATSRN